MNDREKQQHGRVEKSIFSFLSVHGIFNDLKHLNRLLKDPLMGGIQS